MKKKDKNGNLFAFTKGMGILWKAAPGYFIAIIFFSALNGFIAPINTFIWKFFLDDIAQVFVTYTLSSTTIAYLLALSALTAMGYGINAVLQYIKQSFSDRLDLHVTDEVLEKSLIFPMEVYDHPETYNQLNMAISQTSQRCLSLLDTLSEIVFAVIQMIGMIILIVQYSWLIIFVSLISAIPLAWVALKSNTYWYQVFVQRTEKFRLINYLKMIMVKNENVKEIKLFHVGKKIVDLIHENYLVFLKCDKKARKEFTVKRTFAQFFDETISCAVKLWILLSSVQSRHTIGMVVMFFNTQATLKTSIVLLLNQLSSLHNNSLYLQSVQQVLSIQNVSDFGKQQFDPYFSKIEFDNVSFKYPGSETYVLRNISLTLKAGKTYSIVGFNGSGKTTLIKLLLKLYKPISGVIYIDGVDLQQIDTDTYYKNLSAVFQDFIRYPFSVAENIDVGAIRTPAPDDIKIKHAGELSDADEFICGLPDGYGTKLMKDWSNGVDISQGQWQKVAIARCFYKESVIAVLDEPFSSLDAGAEGRIIEQFRQSINGGLSIFITHRFSSITLSDEVIVLENGEITERGTHQRLLEKNGTYAKLYNAQMISLQQL